MAAQSNRLDAEEPMESSQAAATVIRLQPSANNSRHYKRFVDINLNNCTTCEQRSCVESVLITVQYGDGNNQILLRPAIELQIHPAKTPVAIGRFNLLCKLQIMPEKQLCRNN